MLLAAQFITLFNQTALEVNTHTHTHTHSYSSRFGKIKNLIIDTVSSCVGI